MSLFEEIREVVAEYFRVKSEEVKIETSLANDLGADSLDTVELVTTLEEKFDIEIPKEDSDKMQTISDVINFVGSRTNRL